MTTNLDKAIPVLMAIDQYKHWLIKCVNSKGERRRYECTIWGNGRRVSASAFDPLVAVERAVSKLTDDRNRVPTKTEAEPKFKVVR